MISMKDVIFARLKQADTWQLFLTALFPIHVWAILIGFWNFQNVVERSANLMDGIAYLAYALLAAFVESLVFFLFLFLNSYLFPKRFTSKRIVAQLSLFTVSIIIWMVVDQLLAYFEFLNPGTTAGFFLQFSRPYFFTILSGILLLGIAVLLVAAPFFWFERKAEAVEKILGFFERLNPLSMLYLGLDLFAIILVLIRNF